jgi:hypothetical protein
MRDGQPCRTPTAQLRRSGTWAKFSPMTRGRLDSPNVRLNPPTIQFAPSLWAAVCMIGLGVSRSCSSSRSVLQGGRGALLASSLWYSDSFNRGMVARVPTRDRD